MMLSLRLVYRAILLLHPADFRAEFGEEMFWIFDEEIRRGAGFWLLWDGLRSIVVQNVRSNLRMVEIAGPYYKEIDSSLPAERFLQAAVTFVFVGIGAVLFGILIGTNVAVPLYGHLCMGMKFLVHTF